MIGWRRMASALAATVLLASANAEARPGHESRSVARARQAVLLDFAGVAKSASIEAQSSTIDTARVTDVARQLESAFTGAATQYPEEVALPPSPATPSASSLPNPFLTRAVATISASAFHAGGSCVLPEYRPDYSHGRAAELRRRLIFPLVHQVACEQGLPVGLFDALIMQESRYNHLAVSPKGALGLAQLMPGTARQLGANPYAVIENLRGGARYLRQQVDRFGRYDLALAAYNSGPGRVARLGRVPSIAETTQYVRQISANWTSTRLAVASARHMADRRATMIFMPYGLQR